MISLLYYERIVKKMKNAKKKQQLIIVIMVVICIVVYGAGIFAYVFDWNSVRTDPIKLSEIF